MFMSPESPTCIPQWGFFYSFYNLFFNMKTNSVLNNPILEGTDNHFLKVIDGEVNHIVVARKKMKQIENLLKEAKWVEAQKDWKEQKVRNPATGKIVKVKSLPAKEQEKYRPKRKVTPASHSKQINDALKELGMKVDSREKTPGSIKTWLKGPKELTHKQIKEHLEKKLGLKNIEHREAKPEWVQPEGLHHHTFNFERQGPTSHWLQVHGGPRAEESRAGMDV